MTDISQFITVTPLGVSKQYTQGSGQAPLPDTILIQNSSPDTDITATITSIGAVIFSPASFTVPQNNNISVQITYDITQLDSMTQGLNTINTIFNFASIGSTTVLVSTPPLSAATPTLPPIQLAIETVGGPITTVAGQTTDFYATGPTAVSVTFEAYNNYGGVFNLINSSLTPLITWTLNGPNISNAIVGTGQLISVTFPSSGIYVIQAALNTAGISANAQSDIQIVVSVPTPIPSFVFVGPTATPTPSSTPIIDILPKPAPTATPIPTPTPTPVIITPTPFIPPPTPTPTPAPLSSGIGGTTSGNEGGNNSNNLAD